MTRLGKRERAAIAAKRQAKRSKMAANGAVMPQLAEAMRLSPSLNDAYSPSVTKLTARGHGRVMYNIQGSDRKGLIKPKDTPIFEYSETWAAMRSNGLGSKS